MGAPQIIYIVLLSMGLMLSLIKHGEEHTINFWTTLISTGIIVTLLITGGFFK